MAGARREGESEGPDEGRGTMDADGRWMIGELGPREERERQSRKASGRGRAAGTGGEGESEREGLRNGEGRWMMMDDDEMVLAVMIDGVNDCG